jgi:hypothetical protein
MKKEERIGNRKHKKSPKRQKKTILTIPDINNIGKRGLKLQRKKMS